MANLLATVEVALDSRSYSIAIGEGISRERSSFAGIGSAGIRGAEVRGVEVQRLETCAIVTNTTVGPLLAESLRGVLSSIYGRVLVIELPDGEAHKDWKTLQRIFDALLEARCDRKTVIYALGGGVVGDMAGFAAACYMRGVDYVQVPTTLLAQVDSSVGGKTGINHPAGKNMVGAFHQPRAVVIDLDLLATLPRRELVAGLAEVIKYGAIADVRFLEWLEANLQALLAREPHALAHAIRRSCEIKAEVVSADERESGRREILNFGHTFGHAIEAGAGYGEWLHGEAVGCGMAMAADLSSRLGLVPSSFAERLLRLIAAAGLPTQAPPLTTSRYIELMRVDKKALAGNIRFVVLDQPGSATTLAADLDSVEATLRAFSMP